jgi:NADPH2:quinone reductase
MKAIVNKQYGSADVLKSETIRKPIPKENEVLIRIKASTVTSADCMMRKGDTFMSRLLLGLFKPRKKYQIPGLEFSGIIESTGKKVTRFKKGDEVYGFRGFGSGCYAEYKCMDEKGSIALKPENFSFAESASVVDGATTAYFFLKEKADIQKGQNVLINGASGSIGTFAVQLAKNFGAKVTGVCSTDNLKLVQSLGADKVIDYTKEDFTSSEETYDIIFDTVAKSTYVKCKKILNYGGRYVVTVWTFKRVVLSILTKICKRRKLIFAMSVSKNKTLVLLKSMIENGGLKTVIDRQYPISEIVEAHRYVENGHKKGNVVIHI